MSQAPMFPQSSPRSIDENKVGFNDLPRELRDQIYRFALIEPLSMRGYTNPQEICLTHNTSGLGGCDRQHANHSDTRKNFQALTQVSRMVRREAIEMLSKNVQFSCWMPLNHHQRDRKPGIREQQVDGCVCPVLLRHGVRLQIRRGVEAMVEAFEIEIVDGVWQVKPNGPTMLAVTVQDWNEVLQQLLEAYDVQGGFSEKTLMQLRKCIIRADRIINKARRSSRRQ